MQFIFENEEFLIADKPAGWLSVPGRTGQEDPRPCLGTTLQRQTGTRLWPVHRLDFEVSGVIMFARSAAAHKAATSWFETRLVHKTYEALGEVRDGAQDSAAAANGEQRWEAKLLRGKKRAYEHPSGKTSVTLARCSGVRNIAGINGLFFTLRPQTGRPHQLRWEMFRHGHPVAGDTLYGAHPIAIADTIMLRAVRLDLTACPGRAEFGLSATYEAPSLEQWAAPTGAPP